jgi:hypothetical protein
MADIIAASALLEQHQSKTNQNSYYLSIHTLKLDYLNIMPTGNIAPSQFTNKADFML